jgi:hypothetical protein
MVPEMTRRERERQRALLLQAMLLADTRAERHGVYANRKPRKRSSWSMPTVNEKRPL